MTNATADRNRTKTTALEKCRHARQLWLSATRDDDLKEVEALYKSALNAKSSIERRDWSGKPSKSKRQRQTQYAELSPKEYRKAGERLSLLLCQSGRTDQAKKGLEYLNFECRLAREVLDYPTTFSRGKKFKKGKFSPNKQSKNKISSSDPPCIILDNFLHRKELLQLQSVFADRQASYWTNHAYQVEPPSPYFSYVMDLRKKSFATTYGFIGQLANQILSCSELQAKFPDLCKARLVEMWAHNRPHASGHQLHFDSDDEGRGGIIKNPVCSTILYLTTKENMDEESFESTVSHTSSVGGPSLVTNQRLTSQQLATKGWLAHPRPLRLVAFDGRVLHGVIPGKGVQTGRRVTLMMAFWKDIAIRNNELGQGSARPFPVKNYSTRRRAKRMNAISWLGEILDLHFRHGLNI